MKTLLLHQITDPSRADEIDTLTQAKEVLHCLHELGHEVLQISCATLGEIEMALDEEQPQLVFNLFESFHHSDRFAYLAAGLLEARGTHFTGNSASVLMLCANKHYVKKQLTASGVALPRNHLELSENKATTRFIVKSVTEHSSFGIDSNSIVTGVAAAQNLIAAKQAQYGGQWMAEEYIEGRELNLSLLQTPSGMVVLPPAEILFDNFATEAPHIIDYSAKWDEQSYAYQHTLRHFVDAAEIPALTQLAHQCWNSLGLSGYARIDLRLDSSGRPWVIDLNPNPSLAADAGFVAAAIQTGMSQREIIATLVESTTYETSETAPRVA